MKNIRKGWEIKRLSYLIGGLIFIMIGVLDSQGCWMAIFGVYFVVMAIFKFGCASGSCEVNFNKNKTKKSNKNVTKI